MKELSPGNIHLLIYLDGDRAFELLAAADDLVEDVIERAKREFSSHIGLSMTHLRICWKEQELDPQSRLTDYLEKGASLEGSRLSYELHLLSS